MEKRGGVMLVSWAMWQQYPETDTLHQPGGKGLGQSWKNRRALAWAEKRGSQCNGLNYVLSGFLSGSSYVTLVAPECMYICLGLLKWLSWNETIKGNSMQSDIPVISAYKRKQKRTGHKKIHLHRKARITLSRPRREASGETKPSSTWILDSRLPELREDKFVS